MRYGVTNLGGLGLTVQPYARNSLTQWRAGAGFHADEAWRQLGDQRQELLA